MSSNKIKYPYEYDKKKRQLAKVYTKVKIINSIINSIIIPIVFLVLFIALGAGELLQTSLMTISPEFFVYVPLFGLFLALFLLIVQFPLRFYSSFIYEHKYELSNYTIKGWFVDFLKEELISFIFFIPAVTMLYFIINITPLWWLYASIVFAVIITILDFVLPVVLLPFFYKIGPYTDEKQKKSLLDMIKRAGGKDINTILVAKESEKSKKPNAMFTGFGHTKRIILFDTLIDYFTPAETETVIAHELGHYVHKDSIKGLAIEIILMFPILYIISLLIPATSLVPIVMIATLPLFMLFYEVIDLILMPIMNTYSRHVERDADLFSLDVSHKPDAQISTEKRLADMALSDESPPWIVEFLLFDHPAASKRIQLAADWKKKNPHL